MSNEMEEFIEEGVKRYKEASYVMVKFGKEIESRLQKILEDRQEWGAFITEKEAYARSTKFWSEYPLLNARKEGSIKGQGAKVIINISWYQSDSYYPFYSVQIDPRHKIFPEELNAFDWNPNFELIDNALVFYPDPDDFDLEKDFNMLLDEFVRFLKSLS